MVHVTGISVGGNSVAVVGDALKVTGTLIATAAGTQDVNIVAQSYSPLIVSGTLVATAAGTQDVNVVGQAYSPLTISGTVQQGTTPWVARTDSSSTANVVQATSPWIVSGTITSSPVGTQDVNIVGQAFSPLTVSGTATSKVQGKDAVSVWQDVGAVKCASPTTPDYALGIWHSGPLPLPVSGTVNPSGTQDVNIVGQAYSPLTTTGTHSARTQGKYGGTWQDVDAISFAAPTAPTYSLAIWLSSTAIVTGPSGAITTTSTAVQVGTTASTLLPVQSDRHYALIRNLGAATPTIVFLAHGRAPSATNFDSYLDEDDAYEINVMNLWQGNIQAIASATSTVSILEW